jgi:hypothetical protein
MVADNRPTARDKKGGNETNPGEVRLNRRSIDGRSPCLVAAFRQWLRAHGHVVGIEVEAIDGRLIVHGRSHSCRTAAPARHRRQMLASSWCPEKAQYGRARYALCVNLSVAVSHGHPKRPTG